MSFKEKATGVWKTFVNIPKCEKCDKAYSDFRLRDEELCTTCFEEKFGKLVLKPRLANYSGGHKAHPVGGLDGTESGKLALTADFLVFFKPELNWKRRWDITIPLNEVLVEEWGIKEEALSDGTFGNIASTGFFVSPTTDVGKNNQVVIPYLDENKIPQRPRFLIQKLGGATDKECYQRIIEQVVKKKQNQPMGASKSGEKKTKDPLLVLKLRLAEGEITKQEFDEMKKLLNN